MPINIKVEGKIVISDEAAEVDKQGGVVNTQINIDRRRKHYNVSNASSLRIRSNLNGWKLVGNIKEFSVNTKKINPKFINIRFETNAGSTANSAAGRLASPFTAPVSLSTIGINKDFVIVNGSSKTSLKRDPKNENNWFGVKCITEFGGNNNRITSHPIYKKRQYKALVTYTVVSL